MESATCIRMAVPGDWEIIADYNSCLAMETENKQLDPSTIIEGVQTLLTNPQHGRYFVACVGDRIVGQLMHTREWSDWRNGEIWWLQSVYVHPEYRRSGVFRALFRHLEKLAESTPHVIGLRLYAEEHNFKAFEAYHSLGLANAGYVVMERFFPTL
jgi:GNAT superfamily N-acetyltransferase